MKRIAIIALCLLVGCGRLATPESGAAAETRASASTHEGSVLTVVPWRSNQDLDVLISRADGEKTLDALTVLVREIASWGERDPRAIRYLDALCASPRQVDAQTGRNPKDILNDVISDAIQRAQNNVRLETKWIAAERALRATRFSADKGKYKALIEGWGFVQESDHLPAKHDGLELEWTVVAITGSDLILERLTIKPTK